MEFRCRLGTPGGEIIEGVYVADSEDRLRREFEEKGLYVLAIQRAGRLAFGSLALPTRSRIATREFLVFNQELATLLKAGMPLVQSLDILRRRVSNPVFKSVLNDVYDRVRAGSSLSESFEAHGAMFPGVYTASLMAGEKSGNLEQVIRRYVAYVKVVEGVRRKVISALIYPAVLLSLSVVVVGILVLRVVPQFSGYYEQFGQELPLSTRVIVAVSSYATAYFSAFVLLVAAIAVADLGLAQAAGRARAGRSVDPGGCRCSARWRGSSRPRRRRGRWRRCSAAVFPSSTPSMSRRARSRIATWRGNCTRRRSRCAKAGRSRRR